MSRKPRSASRIRVGKVSVYEHHGAWWVYYRDGGSPQRRRVGSKDEAQQVAAQVNGQLASGAPRLLSFESISLPELRRLFLDYHEMVLNSSVSTVHRYRAATQHLENYALSLASPPQAHEVKSAVFTAYLRRIEVAPNGHQNTCKRKLRGKGIQFILATCRSMYTFAGKRRHLPPYAGNPFSDLPLDRMKIEDAKPIFVFEPTTELAFFQAASDWAFPIHFMLAKTGLRVGELVHLLIEDADLERGWLHVRNKAELGWRVKTGHDRPVPLLPEVVAVLRAVIGRRTAGPIFLRERLMDGRPGIVGDRREMETVLRDRRNLLGRQLSRSEEARLARKLWWDAGAIKADAVRNSFVRIMATLGHPEATCPKSWRHSFATLLQDANVDPLVRQITMGHKPTTGTGLGMTATYTHTRGETQRQQIEQALRRWSEPLRYAMERVAKVQPVGGIDSRDCCKPNADK